MRAILFKFKIKIISFTLVIITVYCCNSCYQIDEQKSEIKKELVKINTLDNYSDTMFNNIVSSLTSDQITSILLTELKNEYSDKTKMLLIETITNNYNSNTLSFITSSKNTFSKDELSLILYLLAVEQVNHRTNYLDKELILRLINDVDNDKVVFENSDLNTIGALNLACFELITGFAFTEIIQQSKGSGVKVKNGLLKWWTSNHENLVWDKNESIFVVKR